MNTQKSKGGKESGNSKPPIERKLRIASAIVKLLTSFGQLVKVFSGLL